MAENIITSIIWFLLFFVMAFFYPKMMLSQMIWKLEDATRKMEAMSAEAARMVWKKTKKRDKNTLKRIRKFMDFIVIQPSNLDPYGIVKRIDHIIRTSDKRFEEFSNKIGIGMAHSDVKKINYGLRGAMSVHQIAKVMRHYVEIVKKYKNLQVALIIQMQLPIIDSMIKSEMEGTKAFLNGWPVGDSIGPLVAASHMKKPKPVGTGVVYDETKINGRNVIFMKASGPEPELGRVDDALAEIMKKRKIHRVLTIDAGAKLEGEKTGSVSEGVGFAMGGNGEREIIERMLMDKKIPIDSIVVKMGENEAIKPMTKNVFNSLKDVEYFINESVNRIKKGETIVVIGVGNTIGVRNDKLAVKEVAAIVKKLSKRTKKKKKRLFDL